MIADKDLGSQQNQLASMDYDLRISNLASFLDSQLRSVDIENKKSSLKLLDVGAGNGLFLKYFKNKGFDVSGYELEAELVINMKKDPALKGVSIKQGDITQMTGNNDFDVVIASDVIEHIKDDQKAISGLWSFVKPGGILLITVPGHSFLYGKRDKMWGHFRRYDQKDLLEKVKKATNENCEIAFATQWNFVGFFVYAFYEKILKKSINENMRYSNSPISRLVRFILDSILKHEKKIGGLTLGLTQIVGVKKIDSSLLP
jgi:SAM-dependent methyltransferase